jgi:hypothetical protein
MPVHNHLLELPVVMNDWQRSLVRNINLENLEKHETLRAHITQNQRAFLSNMVLWDGGVITTICIGSI